MKLVEIKNSLAKLYYEPADFPLVLSDFLTIDDGNQKILSQVVSIESTSKDTTNCAILKFSLDLNADNTHCTYSGYVPPLDAIVSRTKPEIISKIFSDNKNGIYIGDLSASSIQINANSDITENFLYIQSDRYEQSKDFIKKLIELNYISARKTLVLDFDGIAEYENANIIKLGKDFKLPVDNSILDYIYENDLTGLTLEQKTIVQDIIIDIQDYIETLDDGYIPFNTLLGVVNQIYETDKSVGVILLRNKLLKYKQYNIFASEENEITSISKSLDENVVTVLKVDNAKLNWQKETLDFIIKFLQTGYYLIMDIKDECIDKSILNKIYKAENIKPVIASKYDSEFCSILKSFAKNLVLFKPLSQQRAFATYNSFLNKLSEKEYILSGEASYYTPLIIKQSPDRFEQKSEIANEEPEQIIEEVSAETTGANPHPEEAELIDAGESENLEDNIEELQTDEPATISDDIDVISPLEEIEPLEETEEESELKTIFEESLEQEIAKDVDKMFYAEAAIQHIDENVEPAPIEENTVIEELPEQSQDIQTEETANYDELLSDDDLDLLDEINMPQDTEEINEISENETENQKPETNINADEDIVPAIQEENLTDAHQEQTVISNDNNDLDDLGSLADLGDLDELPDLNTNPENIEAVSEVQTDLPELKEQAEPEENHIQNDNIESIPVYSTEIDEAFNNNDDKINIAEGNIVYHEKYGRGVVEQLITYGNKTLCSIQFDNVGRRLLDPKLADLKQM